MTVKEKNSWLEILQDKLWDYGICYTKHNRYHRWNSKQDYFDGRGHITSKSKDVIIAWAEGFLEAKGER